MSELRIEDIFKVSTEETVGDIAMERTMATNAIMSSSYLKLLVPMCNDMSLLSSSMVKTIIGWCVEYYEITEKAPKADIQGMFEQRCGKLTGATATDVSDFLTSLSEGFETRGKLNNAAFEAKNTEGYLNTQRVNLMLKKAKSAMTKGNIAKAEQCISNYSRPETTKIGAVDIHNDYSRFSRKKNKEELLFEYPNKNFAEMWGPVCRKHMSMYGAPAKTGKSRAIVRSAVEAFRNGLNVLICTLEMSEDEMAALFDAELLRAGMASGVAFVPTFRGEGAETRVVFVEQQRRGLSDTEMEEITDANKYFNHGRIFIRGWEQKEMTIDGHLMPEIDYIKKHFGVTFDYIAIDYFDLMGVPKEFEKLEERHQLNHKYQAAKRVAQRLNCHVNGATQTDDTGKVREDYRKVNEVNCFISILGSPEEKRCGVYQYRCLANRHVPFDVERVLIGLTNHGIGLAGLDFRWLSDTWDEWLPDIEENFELFKDDDEIDYANHYDASDDFDFFVGEAVEEVSVGWGDDYSLDEPMKPATWSEAVTVSGGIEPFEWDVTAGKGSWEDV